MPLPFRHRSADGASKTDLSRGRKRRFGIAGAANVAATNALLQGMLASNLFSTSFCTLVSQLLNGALGYLIYGKLVFKAEGLRSHKPLLKYMILLLGMWAMNTGGIELGIFYGLSGNVSALAMIPLLAITSYNIQKRWVFLR